MNIVTLKDELIRDEGMRLHPYRCTAGKLTIGVGRNIEDNGITEEEALFLLGSDIRHLLEELDARWPWWRTMTDARQRALVNMAFNMGAPTLAKFKNMLAALEAGDYDRAATEALDSKWARQVGRRADRIANMIREG